MAERTLSDARNARLGLVFFAVYVFFYGGFVATAAFWPQDMAEDVLGVNLAIVYGLALIVLAFVLAAIYMVVCRDDDTRPEGRA